MTKVIVALYDDVALAQKAVDALVAEGLPRPEVSVLSNETIAAVPGAAVGSGEYGPLGDAEVSGADLVPRLTRLGVGRSEAEAYTEGVRRGGGLVVVCTDDARAARATEIMDRAGALDYEAEVRSWRSEGWTGYDPRSAPLAPAEADAERRRRGERRSQPEKAAVRTERTIRRAAIYAWPGSFAG
jgi:hypothetical protein